MAQIEIHGRPIGYSSSKTAIERGTWIGHRVRRLTSVTSWPASVLTSPARSEGVTHSAPHYEEIHGVEQVVWPVVTVCGKRIEVVLQPEYGYADARECELCTKSKGDEPDVLLVEILPPMRRSAQMQMDPVAVRKNRRERGISAAQAF